MLGLDTMEFFTTWVFCLVVLTSHWANAGYVGFEGPPRPNFPKPGTPLQRKFWPSVLSSDQSEMKPPGQVVLPRPTFSIPRQQPFNLVKPQNPVVYPMYKPWRVPTNTQTQSGSSQILPQAKPAQLPPRPPGQFTAYRLHIPSYSVNLDNPNHSTFDPTANKQPNYSFLKLPLQPLSNLNVLPENKRPAPLPANVYLVQPALKNQAGISAQHVPKLPQNSNSQSGMGSPLLDFPDGSRFAPPQSSRYSGHMVQNYPPPSQEQDSSLLQKRQKPYFEWSQKERRWIPKLTLSR